MLTAAAGAVATDPHLADPPTAAGAVAVSAAKSVSAFVAASSSSSSFDASSSSSIYCRSILNFLLPASSRLL